VLDAIADKAQVSVSEGELGEHIVRGAMRYGVTLTISRSRSSTPDSKGSLSARYGAQGARHRRRGREGRRRRQPRG
jgi:hypothetical protein